MQFSSSTEIGELDTERIFRALTGHKVEFIVVGGVAALIRGATRVTVDADVMPRVSDDNLQRLMEALRDLEARVLLSPARQRMESGEPWEVQALNAGPAALRHAEAWHFTTSAGPLDLVMFGAGVGDYEAHVPKAGAEQIFGLSILVAGLDDLIASKGSLNREKDLSVLHELRRLREAE